jgi:hypothetical protein
MSPTPRTWREMTDWIEAMLEKRTGEGLAVWNARIAEAGFANEAALKAWLAERGIGGYPQMLLIMERFGYPDYLTASADQLLDGQYADRPALRPILEAVLALAPMLGSSPGDVSVQARKTYVTLVSPRRQFALIRATTRDRVDLGLRLPDASPGGRLATAKGLGNDTINVRIGLKSVDEVDDEVADLLRRAFAANA